MYDHWTKGEINNQLTQIEDELVLKKLLDLI